jgi:hypothetical protein
MASRKNWDGIERRQHERRRRDVWKRRAFVVWLMVFTLAVGYSINENRHTTNSVTSLTQENTSRISDLRRNKAQLGALQRTNCGLKKFLLTARRARWNAYKHSHRQTDLEAVTGYEKLVTPFASKGATGNCKIPKSLNIPGRPLPEADLK